MNLIIKGPINYPHIPNYSYTHTQLRQIFDLNKKTFNYYSNTHKECLQARVVPTMAENENEHRQP